MSKTNKQTDKIQEDRTSIWRDRKRIKHSKVVMLDCACLYLMQQLLNSEHSPVHTCWLTGCYSLISDVQVAEKQLCCGCIYKCRHLLCGHFGRRNSPISYQLLISSSGPFAMLCVFLYWHTTLWYTLCSCQPWGQLMNLALNQRRVISLLWLDGQVLQDVYLSRFHWWTVAEWTGISCQYSTFLLGHNKTESQPFEKDNLTDITLGGGGETRAGN